MGVDSRGPYFMECNAGPGRGFPKIRGTFYSCGFFTQI